MKTYKQIPQTMLAVMSALAIAGLTAKAQTVWNVNVGNGTVEAGQPNEITTTDNYVGAATENTVNSTWNAVSDTTVTTLADSTGNNTAAVTFKISPASGSSIDFGNSPLTTGDEIFKSWIKDNGNNDLFDITFANLDPAFTYDLVIYSDWFWSNGDALPVTQTAGTGLTGTFVVNRDLTGTTFPEYGLVGPLLRDTDPANVAAGKSNHARFNGLTVDAFNKLSFNMGAANGPVNGFQLIQASALPVDGLITSFSVPGNPGVIDQTLKTISLTVPYGTDLATLAPTFTLGSGTCDQTSGSPPAPTFAVANPATYTVTDTAPDPDLVNVYTVTVTVTPASTACDLLTFNANFSGSNAVITTTGPTTGTVEVHVPNGTTEPQVAALEPSYTVSPLATCLQPNPGVPTPALNSSTPVTYTVTAEDGVTLRNYSVSVTVDPPQAPFMALTGDAPTPANYTYSANELEGYKFTVGASSITVNWLGWYDAANGGGGSIGDGFAGSKQIGLWETSSGTLLAQTTLSAGTAGTTMSGSFRGQNIPIPVVLIAGRTYTVAGYGGGGDLVHEVGSTAGFTVNGITMGVGVYDYAWPVMPVSTWALLIGPNFGYKEASAPFATWSGGEDADVDTNGDGVENAVAWVLGAAGPDANANGLVPTLDNTSDPDFFVFNYRRDDDAFADSNTAIKVQYGSDLAGWTDAAAGADVFITPTDDFYGAGTDKVEVKIRRTLALGGKLFARLNVVVTP